ncbi:hypothetical protein MPLSOD_90217 [Mesorhizobium sp. SOD10]|nr:hypothetical protein MPLSOD_90217 [Mesorhizobium sp. SOD10]
MVRLIVKKSTYSREQNLNQNESAIRRRFVPDSFQPLTAADFDGAAASSLPPEEHSAFARRPKSLCVGCHTRRRRRASDQKRQKVLFPSR